MEAVVTRQQQRRQQQDDALHWSRGFKVVEENLCRDKHRDQPSSRKLEIHTCRAYISGFRFSS
uniref:Uncharacterized protein n=1 Tax=Rhizophora mucronata TaxID=61149 RepID=A0A2P2M416_RHIMU